ncbi:cytochrome c maturation protein CcmE [candidate division KSB1 bacterium]|nr:cytochrome c maturation protein CcmE [candidate division KSB1 bacterium]RQW02035.1 MAG: cytochrome c maturation protein CcmE [candidate division KSB1 bacterium]
MKPKIIIGVVIIIAALGFLIFSGFKDNASYYLTVSELYAKEDITHADGIRIHGYVDPATIEWDSQAIEVYFKLYDQGDTLQVYYQGVKPDQLADAQQVVAEGYLRPDGVFQANRILLKCPSKYEVNTTDQKK